MWGVIAILFVMVLVAISFVAGGAWLIIAVPLALVALAPLAIGALRRRVGGADDLRREREHARPAIHSAAQAEDRVSPPQTP